VPTAAASRSTSAWGRSREKRPGRMCRREPSVRLYAWQIELLAVARVKRARQIVCVSA
jgi:hypothetical protein